MSSRKMSNKQAVVKALMVFEILICYMALLNIISHALGPQSYKVITDEPLLIASDFVSFEGENAQEQSLRLENQTPEKASGYSALLSLEDLERIYISFRVDCSVEQAGTGLCVDLYDQESGYDNAEQEYRLFLQEGVNEVSFALDIGETAPEKAELRIFTGDITDCEICDLQIYQCDPLKKVTLAMIFAFVGGLFVLVATAFVYHRLSKKDG